MSPELRERVLSMLPAHGSIPIEKLWELAAEQKLCTREVAGALGELCTERTVAVQRRGDYSFVRRLPAAAARVDFPIVPRPLSRAVRRPRLHESARRSRP